MKTQKKWKPYPRYKPSGVDWIGNIPEVWGVKKIKYLSSLLYGSSLAVEDRSEGNIPVYGSNGQVGCGVENWNCKITKHGTEFKIKTGENNV